MLPLPILLPYCLFFQSSDLCSKRFFLFLPIASCSNCLKCFSPISIVYKPLIPLLLNFLSPTHNFKRYNIYSFFENIQNLLFIQSMIRTHKNLASLPLHIKVSLSMFKHGTFDFYHCTSLYKTKLATAPILIQCQMYLFSKP